MRKVIVVPVVIGALEAISGNLKEYMKQIGVNVSEAGSHPENSIAGDSKDTKESTVPVRRRRRETQGPMVTYCNPLPGTINKAEYPA